MLLRLPTTLAQAKAGNTLEDLLNEIRQNVYSFLSSYRNYYKSIYQYN